ncbi:hypothetical protein BKA62DRAFT_711426 [Auriculariales sp. MPI-PUGE-AT-0066]|nr:hypothetical protein BKA62DRAFT_711426 [Auriculariales sp. MPI-PUGE-AT-0066]
MNAGYNVTLSASSPMFAYTPSRDGPPETTWNASYTGTSTWPLRPNGMGTGEIVSLPTGRAYRRTQAALSSVELRFHGTEFVLCFSANGATYSIDTNPKASVMTANTVQVTELCGVEAEEAVFAYGLANAERTATLTVAAGADHEFMFFGGQIGLNATGAAENVDVSLEIIDDSAGGWDMVDAPGYPWDGTQRRVTPFNNTFTFNCGYLNTVSISRAFFGAEGFVLFGYVWRDAHRFSLQLDDEPVREMDATSSWEDGRAVFFAKGGLDPSAVHRLTLISYAASDPNCVVEDLRPLQKSRSCCLGVDALVLLQGATDVGGSSTSASPSHAPSVPMAHRINGAVVAGSVAAGALGLVMFGVILVYLLRWRGRSTSHNQVETPLSSPSTSEPTMRIAHFSPESALTALSSDVLATTASTLSIGSGKRAYVPRPSPLGEPSMSTETERAAGSAPTAMTEEEMQRILHYVAARMDRQTNCQRAVQVQGCDPELPGYPGTPY